MRYDVCVPARSRDYAIEAMIQIRLVLNKSGSVNLFRLMINPRAFPNPWKVLSIFRISFGTGSATAIVPAG
jgi:hypothetical protein